MRAAAFTAFGGPDVLQVMELPEPAPGPGEVAVRVVATTVNPTDVLMRAGRQAALMQDVSPPYVAGVEFAGRIQAIGAGVRGFTVGDPVMGLVNARRPGGGSHAEYVRVAVSSLARLESGVDLVAAATIPMNGLTARMSIAALALPAGSTVLVTGGAGAVGGYAIQLARHAGLVVIGDAYDADIELLRRLGAGTVAPRGPGMEEAVHRHCPGGVDGLIDAALLGDRAAALVRRGGSAVSLRRAQAITDARLRTHYVGVFDEAHDPAVLAWLADRLAEGVLTPRIALRLPLSGAAEAYRRVEQGALRGRVVLLPEQA